MNEKYGLVLAGGGSKGSYQIGAWIAMRELKIDFEAVAGVSIGSINGALIAMDDLENALSFWESIEVKKGVNIETPLPDEENLFSPKNWSALFREVLKNGGIDASPTKEFISGFIDEEKVRKSRTRLGLVTVNVTQKTPVYRFLEENSLTFFLLRRMFRSQKTSGLTMTIISTAARTTIFRSPSCAKTVTTVLSSSTFRQ